MNEMFEVLDPGRMALSGAFATAPVPSAPAGYFLAGAESTARLLGGQHGGHEAGFAVRLSLGLLGLALGAAFLSWLRGRGAR